MTVFFVNEPVHSNGHKPRNLKPALEFGDIAYVFSINDEYPGRDAEDAVTHAEAVLKNFDPDTDYIAWAGGDPYALVVVSAVLASWWPQFNFLTYNKRYDKARGEHVAGYEPLTTKVSDV